MKKEMIICFSSFPSLSLSLSLSLSFFFNQSSLQKRMIMITCRVKTSSQMIYLTCFPLYNVMLIVIIINHAI
uniref:Hypothetical secreted peptide n=1 Tax=Glossina morsitans morsitans TaxID=37546 RepID=D3TSI8_GLOMM